MTPAEVIAMRDRLAEELDMAFTLTTDSDWRWIVDWLIKSGWVTSEPGESEGE